MRYWDLNMAPGVICKTVHIFSGQKLNVVSLCIQLLFYLSKKNVWRTNHFETRNVLQFPFKTFAFLSECHKYSYFKVCVSVTQCIKYKFHPVRLNVQFFK